MSKWPVAAAEVAAAAGAAEVAVAAPEVAAVVAVVAVVAAAACRGDLAASANCGALRLRCRMVSSWPGSIRFDPAIMRWLRRCPCGCDALCLPMPAERLVIDPASRRRFG